MSSMRTKTITPHGEKLQVPCGTVRVTDYFTVGVGLRNLAGEDVIREGSSSHVDELEWAIEQYLAQRNLSPNGYVWKKKGEEILAKIHQARTAMEKQKAKQL